jgi:hypothetical protein
MGGDVVRRVSSAARLTVRRTCEFTRIDDTRQSARCARYDRGLR